MKKLSFWLLSMLAVTMLTGCVKNNDEPVNVYTTTIPFNNRAFDGNKVIFSQNNATITIDLTNSTIQFETGFKDIDGVSHTMSTPIMKMTPQGGPIYSFNSGTETFGTTNNLEGFINLETIMVWYSFFDHGSNRIISTSQLIYSFGNTTVTNPDNGNHYNNEFSQYKFIIDAKAEKCVMLIYQFAPNLNGTIQAEQIYWEGLSVTPTTTGYTVSSLMAESSLKDRFAITNLHFTLDDQCRVLNGGFKCEGLDFKVSSKLFP